MSEIKQPIKRADERITVIGLAGFVSGMILLVISFIGILSIENSSVRTFLLLLFVCFAMLASISNIGMIRSFRKNQLDLLTQESSVHQALKYNKRSVNQLQVAAEIARDATAQANLQGLLDRSVQLICEQFDFYHSGIFLIDEATGYAVIRAAYGVDASQKMLEKGHKLKVGEEGIVGFVTKTGQPRIVLDTDADEFHYKNPVLPETNSELALPFRVGNKIIGALDVQSLERNAFDQDDVNILQTLADLLAVAIDKANLNETVQAYADELEIRVQQRTQQLEEEHAQVQAILNGMSDGLIYDEKLKIIYTNKALTELTGHNFSTWDGLLKPLKPESMSNEALQAIEDDLFNTIAEVGYWSKDIKLARADGTEFDASVISTGVQHDPTTKTVKGAVTIIRDISERKALEEQKSRFIANAAHELRTPITNMKTRLYLIRHQPDRVKEHYEVMQSVTTRMQRLIDDLLDMSRFERGKIQLSLQTCKLQTLIQEVIEIQRPEAEGKSLELLATMADDDLFADVDYDRMIQVLTNLINNAINYTEKGCITVYLAELDDTQIEICVEDTGIGIQPEMIQHIFQPFIRIDQHSSKGTGLGLNIALDIVHLHDGELEVESVYGTGSKFYIRLPKSKNALSVR